MLREKRRCSKGRGCVKILLIIAYIPHPWLKRIDLEFSVCGIDVGTSGFARHVFILALNIQADQFLATLQRIEQKHFQQMTLAFAGAAKDQRIGSRFVFGTTVKVNYDGTAVFIIPDIESLAVRFTCVSKWEKICHAGDRQHPLELFTKGIVP